MTHLLETVNNKNPDSTGNITLNVSDIDALSPSTSALLGVDASGDFALTSAAAATLPIAFSADLRQTSWSGTANYSVNFPLDYRNASATIYNDGTVTPSKGIYNNWTGTWQLGAGQYIVHARWSSRSTAAGRILFRLYNTTDSTYHGNYTRLGKGRASCTVHAYLNLSGTKSFQFRVTDYIHQVQYMTSAYLPAVHVKFYRLA
jgi:hypothetical protein